MHSAKKEGFAEAGKKIFLLNYLHWPYQTNTSYQNLFLLLSHPSLTRLTIRQIRLTHLDPNTPVCTYLAVKSIGKF